MHGRLECVGKKENQKMVDKDEEKKRHIEPVTQDKKESKPEGPCCGNCYFGDPIPMDLKSLVCVGVPPSPVPMVKNGSVMIGSFYGTVQKDHRPCAFYKPKTVIQFPVNPN